MPPASAHWSDRLFSRLRIHRFQSSSRSSLSRSSTSKSSTPKGLLGEFWLGTQLGLLWTPCAGTILGSILVLAAVDHQITGAFRLLLVYGIGAALPLLAIAYGGRTLSRRLSKIRAYSEALQRVGGVIVVITAIAILLGWDVQIQL